MKKVQHQTSKRFTTAAKKVDPNNFYSLTEAIKLARETSTVKFDASMEAHINLGINPKKTDQQIRSSVVLPHGTGKTVKIAVVTDDSTQQKTAQDAGADLVGGPELIEEIKGGKINFDVLIATPIAMKLLAPVAKVLGPKGLMPNPKDGTVTPNLAEAVANLKKGKVAYKNDDSGNVHVMFGKVSFETEKLAANFKAILDSITKVKPSSAKGGYIKSINISSSMGPGIKVQVN